MVQNFPCKQSTDIENISAGPKYYPMPCEGFVNEDLITSHLHTKKTQIVEDFSSSKSQGMAIVLLNSLGLVKQPTGWYMYIYPNCSRSK